MPGRQLVLTLIGLFVAGTLCFAGCSKEAEAPKERAAGTVEGKQETKPEAKPEPKPEAKPEAEPDAKPEAKLGAKLGAKLEAKPELKPEVAATPLPLDPVVVLRNEEFVTQLPGGKTVSLGKAGERASLAKVIGQHLVVPRDNKLVGVELATGKETTLLEPLFYGLYTDLNQIHMGDCLSFNVGNPETAEEDENYEMEFVDYDTFCVPMPGLSKEVSGVQTSPQCKWLEEAPASRSTFSVDDRGKEFVVSVKKPDGTTKELGAIGGFPSPDSVDQEMEEDGHAINSLVKTCYWMVEWPVVRCVLELSINDAAPYVILWYNEENGAFTLSDDLMMIRTHDVETAPSECYQRVGKKLAGVTEAAFDGVFVGWVGAPVKATPTAPAVERPSVLSEFQWEDVNTECSSSDKPIKSASKTVSYSAAAITDGTLDTAWAEGKDGSGYGEWVELQLPEAVPMWGIRVWNGYQKTRNDKFGNRFNINERVEAVLVEWGGKKKVFVLQDTENPQDLELDGTITDKVRLSIRGVYKAKYPDTCLSEVAVITGPAYVADKSGERLATRRKETAEEFAAKAAKTMTTWDAQAIWELTHDSGPLKWEHCGVDGYAGNWNKPDCRTPVKMRSAKELENELDSLQENDNNSFITGKVGRCRRGICAIAESSEESESEGRIHTIYVKQIQEETEGREIWVLTGVRFVFNR